MYFIFSLLIFYYYSYVFYYFIITLFLLFEDLALIKINIITSTNNEQIFCQYLEQFYAKVPQPSE